jgi:two-component system KDP operon response regulator KdpE
MTKGEPTQVAARVLVVEDEARLVRLIRAVLETQGHQVSVVPTGLRAIEHVALESPDLILLDLRLPGELDGFDVCRRIREFSMTPIIMVTASAREEEKLAGFDAGADDYITKPFSSRELLARVGAVLRRTWARTDSPAVIETGDLTINLASQRVTVAGEPVHLTPTEYRLLLALARQPDRVLTHTELLTEVWGVEYRDELDYLRTYMRYLRRKLEPDSANPRYLITRPGVGYVLSTEQEPPK